MASQGADKTANAGHSPKKASKQRNSKAAAASGGAGAGNTAAAAAQEINTCPMNADTLIIRELCTGNGIACPAEGGSADGSLPATTIECFFFGVPRIPRMAVFSGLRTVKFVDQTVARIECLEECVGLRELWLAECRVSKIQNLSRLVNLEVLHLYSNRISRIEGLSTLTSLRVLWLSSNQITNIENLEQLQCLEDLNLAGNQISRIGKSLDSLVSLKTLNTSGNPLQSLNEYRHLARLPKLKSLMIRDPRYGVSTVSSQPNSSTHVLFHLPRLRYLDGEDISSAELKDTVNGIAEKKCRYYRQQKEALQRTANHLQRQIHVRVMKACNQQHKNLRRIEHVGYRLSVELEEARCRDPPPEDSDPATHPLTLDEALYRSDKLRRLRQETIQTLESIGEWSQGQMKDIDKVHSFRMERLQLQLESLGNVILEEAGPGTPWFDTCHNFVKFHCGCAHEQPRVLEPLLVTRITNHRLHKQFSDHVNHLLPSGLDGEAWLAARNKLLQKEVKYLFYIKTGKQDGHSVVSAADSGCEPVMIGDLKGVLVTENIFTYCKYVDPSLLSATEDRHCQVLLVQALLGDIADASTAGLKAPDVAGDSNETLLIDADRATAQLGLSGTLGGKRTWLVRESWRVLPEFIVEFCIQPKKPSKLTATLLQDALVAKDKRADALTKGLQDLPTVQGRQFGMALPAQVALSDAAVQKLDKLLVLDLSCSGLSNLMSVGLDRLEAVRKLVLNNNHFSTFPMAVAKMELLQELYLDYNFLPGLSTMPPLFNLRVLSLKGNNFIGWRETVAQIRRKCPSLKQLDLRYNPWQKKNELLRLWAISTMACLQKFDGVLVKLEERELGEAIVNNRQVFVPCEGCSDVTIEPNICVTDTEPLRALSLGSTADGMVKHSLFLHAPIPETEIDMSKVTALCLVDQDLVRLSHFERLVNLKWATLSGNALIRLEGILKCSQLEELIVDNNSLEHLDGIGSLVNLRRLSAGSNLITDLESSRIGRLKRLQMLSIASNYLTSLAPLEKLTSLVELYAGNNLLPSLRCLFAVKGLKEVRNADFFGNPFSVASDNYRVSVLFQMGKLQSLDGVVVDSSELVAAKEKYEARLNLDCLAEHIKCVAFDSLTELDLPGMGLKAIDLGGDSAAFRTIRSINLQGNQLTRVQGLTVFTELKVLCLTKNSIEHVLGKPVYGVPSRLKVASSSDAREGETEPLFTQLEVLHLAENNIASTIYLQLHRFPALVALYLQGNSIQHVDHPRNDSLRELVLDRNRLRDLDVGSFAELANLRMLHVEENRIRSLTGFEGLDNLERLYLGKNCIKELIELEKLITLTELKEVSLLNNPVTGMPLHRPLLIMRQSPLVVIDGQPVTAEERQGVVQFFIDRQRRLDTAQGCMQPAHGLDARGHGPSHQAAIMHAGQHGHQPRVSSSMLPVMNQVANPLSAEPHWTGNPNPPGAAPAMKGYPRMQPFQSGNVGQHHIHGDHTHQQHGRSNRHHGHRHHQG